MSEEKYSFNQTRKMKAPLFGNFILPGGPAIEKKVRPLIRLNGVSARGVDK